MSTSWIQTRSGLRVDLLDPQPEQIDILDIAYSLSMLCRWNGHTNIYYSVAQHSVLCSMYASAEFALPCLMHDAAEAYIGDIARPLKNLLGSKIHGIEETLLEVIADKYDFPYPFWPEIKKIDNDFLETEWYALMGGKDPLTINGRKHNLDFMSWSPLVAHRMFMERFNRLTTNLPQRVVPSEDERAQATLWHERLSVLSDAPDEFVNRYTPRMNEL